MRVLLKETVQGAGISGRLVDEDINVTILEPGEIYEVGDNLGAWLLEHNKADPAGASMIQPKVVPTAKAADTDSESVKPVNPDEVKNDPEPATTEPIMGTGKGKGKK